MSGFNGYTSIEALDKLSTMPCETTHTSPLSPQPHHTLADSASRHNRPMTNISPSVITELQEPDYNKEHNLLATFSPTATCPNRQPNNNNNTIHGYVTQQQLANFGTNVALGKEMNT